MVVGCVVQVVQVSPTSQPFCLVMTSALERLSIVLGYGYFTAWTVSFYPQIIMNHSRKSVLGLSYGKIGKGDLN